MKYEIVEPGAIGVWCDDCRLYVARIGIRTFFGQQTCSQCLEEKYALAFGTERVKPAAHHSALDKILGWATSNWTLTPEQAGKGLEGLADGMGSFIKQLADWKRVFLDRERADDTNSGPVEFKKPKTVSAEWSEMNHLIHAHPEIVETLRKYRAGKSQ